MLSRYKAHIIAFVILLVPSIVLASGRAGVVVRHSDGSVKKSCVVLGDRKTTSYNLLERAGFSPVADKGFIVEIDGEKAKSAWEPGASNDYWSFWKLNNSKWSYSNIGADSTTVVDGEVDGWQKGSSELKLPAMSFKDICPDAAPAEASVQASPINKASPEQSQPAPAATPAAPKKKVAQSSANIPSAENPKGDQVAVKESPAQVKSAQQVTSIPKSKNNNLPIYLILLFFITGLFAPFLLRRRKMT